MFGDLLSPLHLIIVLIVALLIFGPKRLPEIGAGLGKSIREFRDSMNGAVNNAAPADTTEIAVQAKAVPEQDATPKA